jgi:hypothetical protein
MVRPEVILATFELENYRHSEDFFFRSVHLATECWSFVALEHLRHALRLSLLGNLHNMHHAAALVCQSYRPLFLYTRPLLPMYSVSFDTLKHTSDMRCGARH